MICEGGDKKQSLRRGMSKCQKEEVPQRGKRKVIYRRIEENSNIIFRINIVFRMLFAHHL